MSDTQEPQSTNEVHDQREQPSTYAEPRSEPAQRAQPSTHAEPRSEPDGITPPLARMIASIHAALSRGASAEARAVGATACHSILTVLEAKPGQPLAATPPPANVPTSPLTALLSQPGLLSKLAAMSREQLLDLLKQFTGAMPTAAQAPASAGPRFHIVEVPRRNS